MSHMDYFLLAHRGISAGHRYLLNSKSLVRMGRNSQNDVRFDFADIADFHIEIEWMGNRHELAVLGHTMKTLVNEQGVMPLTRRVLKSGDMIQLGEGISFQYMTQPKLASEYPNHPQAPVQGGYPNHPQAPTQGAIVVAQSAYPVPKAIPVIRISSPLTHPTRIGCKFCLYTLDPNDPNHSLRSFVKVGEHHYHRTCYDQLNPKPDEAPIAITINAIEPLEWKQLSPVVVNPGPTNTMEDMPLGISVGTVTLNNRHETTDFYIRNNSPTPLAISRIGFVSWMYLHHNHRLVGYDFDYQLHPAEEILVTIMPHAVRPFHVTKEHSILDHQVIDVVSGGSMSFVISLIVGMVTIFIHFLVLMMWSFSGDIWVILFSHLLSSILLVSWMIYMIPGRLFQIANRLMKLAYRLGTGVGNKVYNPMSRFISNNRLPMLLQNPSDYVGFSVVMAVMIVGLVYIPTFVLLSLFPPQIRFFFSVGYMVIIGHIFNLIIYDYNDDPLYFTQRLWQNIKQMITEAQAINK